MPAYAISGFIGWARFRDNAHWVTDVVSGSAIGLAVGRTVSPATPEVVASRAGRDQRRWRDLLHQEELI